MVVGIPGRRDVIRRHHTESGEVAVDALKAIVDQTSDATVSELERLIVELSSVRDMLRSEADRVQRELQSYASTGQAAMTTMKTIAGGLAHWRSKSL